VGVAAVSALVAGATTAGVISLPPPHAAKVQRINPDKKRRSDFLGALINGFIAV
jgi:hypothetical protein